jgi:Lipopolysaccharide-assembly
MKVITWALMVLVVPFFGSCAGYRLGGVKPAALSGVTRIAVPMFENGTLHPRAEVLATSAVTDALSTDGTYRLSRRDDADVVLEGRVADIGYSTLRGSRLDTLLPEELANQVTIQWTLRDARNPTKVLAQGKSVGKSQLFVSSNLQTARNNALPEAMERASEQLVSRLSTGF